MAKALIWAALILALAMFVVVLVGWWRHTQIRQEDKKAGRPVRGDMTAKQEREVLAENAAAANIYEKLLAAAAINVSDPWKGWTDMVVLPVEHREEIETWLRRHRERKGSS